jgi:hypothetical protein
MNTFTTPILLIIFKRQASLAAQLNILRALRPVRLYVFADGPANMKEETECQKARAVLDGIDWPCAVHRKFMDLHLGCGRGPATAMDWFFENVEEGIILEDDLLPHPDFFPYCAELMERFRNDPRVMEISGTNRLGSWHDKAQSYHFSNWGSECGWATWRRAWRLFDFDVRAWAEPQAREALRTVLRRTKRVLFLSRILDQTFHNPAAVSWWDYQWVFAKMLHNGLAAVPAHNLVRNVGCDSCSNHDRDKTHSFSMDPKLAGIPFPLRHPTQINANHEFDEALLDTAITTRHYLSSLLPRSIKQYVKRILPHPAEGR